MPAAGVDYKAQVLAATDIVQLIGTTVALRRRGKDYVGLCPFHQEKTPSFHVSPSRQFFHCYGCKAGGNAIDFVMRRDRIEFIDALRLVGEQAGIEMPRYGVSKQKAGERQALFDMQSAACGFFEKLLAHPEHGLAARAYLQERRIDDESIRRFQIGYAPDTWDALLRSREMRKFPPPQLAAGGLVKPRQQGEGFYDTFRHRLMFPIRDENGRVIAFGGRKMPGSADPAKYLNSPETPLFAKGRCLFGLDLARSSMVETRTAIVVEGYTDVVVAHQCGVRNVVSPLGTALTEQHVAILRRFADRVVLLFDADDAGDLAVDRAVGLFLSQPIEIAIAAMPAGVDPDEFLLAQGADAFRAVLDGAADALSYKWKQLIRNVDASGNDLTGQQKAVEAYLDLLASARGTGPVDPIRWGAALARVSRLTEIPVDELNRRFRTRRGAPGASASPGYSQRTGGPAVSAGPAPGEQRVAPASARARAERWILGALLIEPARWHEVQKVVHLDDFLDPRHRQVAELYWNHQRDEGEPVFNEFLGALPNPELVELAIRAVDEVESLADAADPAALRLDCTLAEAIEHLEQERRSRDEKKLLAALRRTTDQRGDADEVALLKQLQETFRKPDLRRV